MIISARYVSQTPYKTKEFKKKWKKWPHEGSVGQLFQNS